jgi:hypothetical protein
MSTTWKDVPIRLKQLLKRAKMVNGCGPEGAAGLVPDWVYTSACDEHDFLYHVGCTEADRLAADIIFYHAMIRCADEQGSWWSRVWYRSIAKWRYYAVRWWASGSFYYADRKQTLKELEAEATRRLA